MYTCYTCFTRSQWLSYRRWETNDRIVFATRCRVEFSFLCRLRRRGLYFYYLPLPMQRPLLWRRQTFPSPGGGELRTQCFSRYRKTERGERRRRRRRRRRKTANDSHSRHLKSRLEVVRVEYNFTFEWKSQGKTVRTSNTYRNLVVE